MSNSCSYCNGKGHIPNMYSDSRSYYIRWDGCGYCYRTGRNDYQGCGTRCAYGDIMVGYIPKGNRVPTVFEVLEKHNISKYKDHSNVGTTNILVSPQLCKNVSQIIGITSSQDTFDKVYAWITWSFIHSVTGVWFYICNFGERCYDKLYEML